VVVDERGRPRARVQHARGRRTRTLQLTRDPNRTRSRRSLTTTHTPTAGHEQHEDRRDYHQHTTKNATTTAGMGRMPVITSAVFTRVHFRDLSSAPVRAFRRSATRSLDRSTLSPGGTRTVATPGAPDAPSPEAGQRSISASARRTPTDNERFLRAISCTNRESGKGSLARTLRLARRTQGEGRAANRATQKTVVVVDRGRPRAPPGPSALTTVEGRQN
jgi:hypothetical protein